MLTQELVVSMQAKLQEAGVEQSKKATKANLDAFKAVIVDALKRGEDVEIKGFVDFTSKEAEAYTGRNPNTGEAVEVPACRRATATLSKSLRKF